MERIQFILDNDQVIRLFGMELEEAREGYVKISVTVRDEHLNAHNIAHGALIFALADVAFAIAVNSVTDAVGVQWSFNTFRAAMPGERITAECDLTHRGKSLMVVDYRVSNEAGKMIAKGQATALPVPRERFKS